MRIAFVVGDISSAGGIERVLSILSNLFVERGHDITIVSLFRAHEKMNYHFNSSVKIISLSHYQYALKKQGGILRLCMFGLILTCAKRYFKVNNFDIIMGEGFPVNLILYLIGKKQNVVACEHVYYNYYSKIVRRLRLLIYKKFKAVVVLTQNDKRHFDRYLSEVYVIPNPVLSNPQKKSDISSLKMISVGRLEPQKGYDMLLQALPDVFKLFPKWRLHIWGSGVLEKHLIRLRDKLHLQNHVIFCGVTDNIEQEYISSSLFIMSSRYEGFPMALIEAISYGLPVVSFDCPEGPSDILKDGGGVLVPPNDIVGLKNAIIQMLLNENDRRKCAAEGPIISKKYSPDNIYSYWSSLLDKLL